MPGIFQPRANEYMKGKDSTTGQPEPVNVTNGAFSVASSPNFVGTAAECQTQANLLDTTDVGVYTFFATNTNQYGTLSSHNGVDTGTITWETDKGAAYVAIKSGGFFSPSNNTATLAVTTEAGDAAVTQQLATGAVSLSISCVSEAGTAGNTTFLYVGYGSTAADAAANVSATAGSEVGMMLTNNVVAGWIISNPIGIPFSFRDGGFVAFACLGANGTDYPTLLITQG